ncbi:MAG: discoidin domain-containing protein [Myxococcaceae bacterium]|nr:discoidin domain-containing protein [Myxococcaceae bacterium]
MSVSPPPSSELPSNRRLLVSALALVFTGVLTAGLTSALHAARNPVDLAAGKPRSQSSVLPNCPVALGVCTGAPTRIIFCTEHEQRPWYQIDLGEPTDFSRLTVVNRSDMLPERAVPLVVQVSDDGVTFRDVARREAVFDTWRADLGQQRARFVRLFVDKAVIFHLDAVRVHR